MGHGGHISRFFLSCEWTGLRVQFGANYNPAMIARATLDGRNLSGEDILGIEWRIISGRTNVTDHERDRRKSGEYEKWRSIGNCAD